MFKSISITQALLIQIATFYNVWIWYILRITDKSDDPLCIIALISVIAFIFIGKSDYRKSLSPKQLNIIILNLLIYILSYNYVGDMIHAIFAIFSIGYTFCISKEKISPAIFGLMFLSLPLIASMQFYLGYPLRMISGFFTTALLKMNGFYVIQEGTCLKFGKSLVCIDAPCSGVNMLWAGLFLGFFMSCLYKLNFKKSFIVSIISFISIILANIIRATSLFYIESGLLKDFNLPSFAHQGIGLITFIFSVLLIFVYINYSEKKCDIQYL